VIGSSHTPDAGDAAAGWITAIAEVGDRESFISLFNHFAPRVKSYLIRRRVDEQRAEELTQDAFLTVWRKAGQFDPSRASAGAWIFTIARNLWIDAIRREHHPDDGCMPDPPETPATPEDELKTVEGVARLQSALKTLPIEQAQVMRLSFFEDFTHWEIAKTLDLPLGTVKSRIRLATGHLRRALEGYI
jgi:RNA polymerase sigma-70 factor (ECF subfamily)